MAPVVSEKLALPSGERRKFTRNQGEPQTLQLQGKFCMSKGSEFLYHINCSSYVHGIYLLMASGKPQEPGVA